MEVELLTELQPDIPLAVADRVLTTQSLRSVIQNAVQAATAARMGQRRVTVWTGTRTAGEPIVRVSDNGDGISQDAMTSVFTKEFTAKPDGEGIGLQLVKEIADLVGGTVWAERNPDRGMTFSMTFRAAAGEANKSL